MRPEVVIYDFVLSDFTRPTHASIPLFVILVDAERCESQNLRISESQKAWQRQANFVILNEVVLSTHSLRY